jgi:adenylate cyclase
MRRDAQALIDNAKELKNLASVKLKGWLGQATWQHGDALALLGNLEEGIAQMREGLEIKQFSPERCHQTGCLRSIAEARGKIGRPEKGLNTLDKAIALVEKTNERYCEAEIYRTQGELLLLQDKEAETEISLQKAIEVARCQQAKSWELRASLDLARLWQGQGKKTQAQKMLSEIYNWFTEGFDTPDLKEAKALLDDLR